MKYTVTGIAAGLIVTIGMVLYWLSSGPKTDLSSTTFTSNTLKSMYPPVGIQPANDDTVPADTVIFLWNSATSAKGYLLHLSKNNTFSDTILLKVLLTDTSCLISNEEHTESLYWRIGTITADSSVIWSLTYQLHFAKSPPGLPVLLSPSDNKTGCKPFVAFMWKHHPDVEMYRLQIAPDTGFAHCTFDTAGNWPGKLTIGPLAGGNSYFWRLRAETGTNTGKWSSVFSFRVKMSGSKKNNPYRNITLMLKKNDLSGAYTAIEAMNPDNPRVDTLKCRLAEKYLNAGNSQKADHILTSVTLQDKYLFFLRGKLLLSQKDFNGASNSFEKAVTAKTLFNLKNLHADVCYFRAVAEQSRYNKYKNEVTRRAAINSWETVWKLYKDTPAHNRFKEAVRESNRLVAE